MPRPVSLRKLLRHLTGKQVKTPAFWIWRANRPLWRLWVQVYRYIEQHYDLSKVKRVYINADGGMWIKTALSYLDKSKYVLDGFRLKQTLFRMTACLKGAAGEAKELQNLVRKITEGMDTEADDKRLLDGLDYILNNFKVAKTRLSRKKY